MQPILVLFVAFFATTHAIPRPDGTPFVLSSIDKAAGHDTPLLVQRDDSSVPSPDFSIPDWSNVQFQDSRSNLDGIPGSNEIAFASDIPNRQDSQGQTTDLTTEPLSPPDSPESLPDLSQASTGVDPVLIASSKVRAFPNQKDPPFPQDQTQLSLDKYVEALREFEAGLNKYQESLLSYRKRLEETQAATDEMEAELRQWSQKLDEREANSKRETVALRNFETALDTKEATLNTKEAALNAKEAALKKRCTNVCL